VVNVECYGSDVGIKVDGFDKFIPYTKTMCPYFDELFLRFKTNKPQKDENTTNEDTKDD